MRAKDIHIGSAYAIARYSRSGENCHRGTIKSVGAGSGTWVVSFDEPMVCNSYSISPLGDREPTKKEVVASEWTIESRRVTAAWEPWATEQAAQAVQKEATQSRLTSEQEMVTACCAELIELIEAGGFELEAPFSAISPVNKYKHDEGSRWCGQLTLPPEMMLYLLTRLRERVAAEANGADGGADISADGDGSALASLLGPILSGTPEAMSVGGASATVRR